MLVPWALFALSAGRHHQNRTLQAVAGTELAEEPAGDIGSQVPPTPPQDTTPAVPPTEQIAWRDARPLNNQAKQAELSTTAPALTRYEQGRDMDQSSRELVGGRPSNWVREVPTSTCEPCEAFIKGTQWTAEAAPAVQVVSGIQRGIGASGSPIP
jgi:hypothetical protein